MHQTRESHGVRARFAIVAVAIMVLPLLSGCAGVGDRSQWAYDMTQLDVTYRAGKDGAGVIVAILDTGINLGHPSLDHLKDGNRDNGEVIAFKDFLGTKEGVSNAFDENGHGSHVAGIVAARGGGGGGQKLVGGIDLLGGAPAVQLVIARVCNAQECKASVIDDAIRWAVNAHGARIINLSLGGFSGLPRVVDEAVQTEVASAINAAIDRGVVVVAAAGNDGAESSDVRSPASIQRVIAVGAVNRDGKVASISNHGSNGQCSPLSLPGGGRCDPHKKPEVVAPGVDVLSAWTGDAFVKATGTSQATPFVASVVAVLLQDKPALRSGEQVVELKRVLMDTALPLQGQARPHDPGAGYGLIQAQRALVLYG
jgi:subtilisin family serine protease